jgi:uncharacterized membrane protein YfcA
MTLITDPWFYYVAIPAVILVGLSKGGLAGGVGFVGVPLMALAVSPVQAAAILLPILCVMDAASLWTWRGVYDRRTLVEMLPGGILGVGLGWLLAAVVTVGVVKLIVGLVAAVFVGRALYRHLRQGGVARAARNRAAATFWGAVSGFTSFVAHTGGPPYQIYALPLRLDPKVLAGTTAIFFTIINAIKLVPYFALGQFDAVNLATSAVLMPLAPLSTFAGAWLVRRIRPDLFYALTYVTVGLIAVKLIYDAVADLVWS